MRRLLPPGRAVDPILIPPRLLLMSRARLQVIPVAAEVEAVRAAVVAEAVEATPAVAATTEEEPQRPCLDLKGRSDTRIGPLLLENDPEPG